MAVDGAVVTAILAEAAIVPEDEILVLAKDDKAVFEIWSVGASAAGKIRLDETFAVHHHDAVPQVNGIAGHANDALNGQVLVSRVAKHHNIAALGLAIMIAPAVEEVAFAV